MPVRGFPLRKGGAGRTIGVGASMPMGDQVGECISYEFGPTRNVEACSSIGFIGQFRDGVFGLPNCRIPSSLGSPSVPWSNGFVWKHDYGGESFKRRYHAQSPFA